MLAANSFLNDPKPSCEAENGCLHFPLVTQFQDPTPR
jgi:hypothetical protein